LQFIATGIGGQARDRVVEIAMFDAQLDQLPGDFGSFVSHKECPPDWRPV